MEKKNCLSCKHGLGALEFYNIQETMYFHCKNDDVLTSLPACVTICVATIHKQGELFLTNHRNGAHATVITACPAWQGKE